MSRAPDTAEALKLRTTAVDQWYGKDDQLGQCWEGVGGRVCRGGYVREDYWIKGLGRQVRLSTHILAWILDQLGPMERDALYLAYVEFRTSGLQLDHACENPACRRPSHLVPCTQSENIMAGKDRAHARAAARLGEPFQYHEEPEEEPEF